MADLDLIEVGQSGCDLCPNSSNDVCCYATVSVLLGIGEGAFQSPVIYDDMLGYGGYYSVAIGDINDDGNLDLAMSKCRDEISVMFGNGNGTFQNATNFATGYAPSCSLAVDDLDGDGDQDLAISGDSGVSILINKFNEYNLWVSTSSNRSNPWALSGQTVSDNIYAFTSPDDNVKRVTFYLDGVKRRVENYAAYDLEGTAGNALANPCDTTLLAEGDHEITALIELTTGGSEELTANFKVGNDGGPSAYNLQMSTSSNRSNPVALSGQTVSDNIYAFTSPHDDVKRVTFYLDGVKHRVENYAAYDLEGTAGNGLANPCDTTLLAKGDHEVRAVVELTTGGTEEVTAVFTVDNDGVISEYDLWMSTSLASFHRTPWF